MITRVFLVAIISAVVEFIIRFYACVWFNIHTQVDCTHVLKLIFHGSYTDEVTFGVCTISRMPIALGRNCLCCRCPWTVLQLFSGLFVAAPSNRRWHRNRQLQTNLLFGAVRITKPSRHEKWNSVTQRALE